MMPALFTLQIVLLVFHQVTTLFDLYPFNNVRQYTLRERLQECSVNGLLMAIPPFGFYFGISWMMTAALFVYPALLFGEYLSWWQPYFFGASQKWQQTYNRIFRHTSTVLPPIGNNPIPNLEHCILHGLTLITTICTYIYFFST